MTIATLADGRFWIASNRRLYEGATGESSRGVELPLEADATALFATSTTIWVGSSSGEILVATRNGNRESPTFRRFGTARDFVNSFYMGADGDLWVGTRNGLGRFHLETDTVQWIGRENGLPSPNIAGILGDADGSIWFGSNGGVTRLDPRTGAMSHFGSAEGAQGTGYADRVYARGAGDTFYFAGRGVTAFRPRDVRVNPHPPRVVFSGLELLHERVGPNWRDPLSPLTRAVYSTDAVTLGSDASVFSVEFTGLQYSDPKRTQYRYRLEGFDPDWIETDADRRVATYTRLAPGDYTLRVRAGTKHGIWSESEATLAIRIRPPWWRTLPAIVLWVALAFLAATGVWSGVQRRTRYRIALMERETLRRASLTDPLTGLYNRRFLETYLQHEIPRVLRAHEEERGDGRDADLLFLLVDVDHFKSVNDRHSHGVGDLVLKRVAGELAGAIRGSDLALRWGGDEFLIVARLSDSALATIERLRQKVEQGDPVDPRCTVSIGYARFPILHDQPRALSWKHTLDLADRALLLTKNRRRNSHTGLLARPGTPSEVVEEYLRGGADAAIPDGIVVVESETELTPDGDASQEPIAVEQEGG